MMKRFWIALAGFVLITLGMQAQQIEIRGTVKDTQNKEGIEFINVALWTVDSLLVGGATTDLRGRFTLTGIEAGDYSLAVSGVGYRRQGFSLAGLNGNLTLPDIMLEEESFELAGVTVTASNQSDRIDRKLIFPTEQQLKASTNGIDLLMQLSLPKVSVNLMNMTASLIGSGELQYRINGAKVELQDILALQPDDIIRVEYHDNPGLRYGNAEVVLDYIVRRPETGGNGGVRSDNGYMWKLMNTNLYGRVNHRKSEFSVNYNVNYRDFKTMWRDNEERFVLGNESVLNRKEEGIPGRIQYLQHNVNTAYSYQNDRRMFNAALRFYGYNQPHFDYQGTLYNMSNPEDRVNMIDNTVSKTFRPAVDLYYQENLQHGQTLVLNLVGTYNYTENNRFYDENRDDVSLTHVDNGVTGKKYSWIGEGIYEKAMGANRLSMGVRHTQSVSNNTYRNGHDYTTEMTQGETFVYAEFKGKAQKLDYMLGLGATRSFFDQANDAGKGYGNYAFNPRFTLQYSLPGQSSVRLRSEATNISPSLSELSAIDQTVDSLQIQRGNPTLKPYLRYYTQLTYNFTKRLFNLNLESSFEYRPNAIMDEKFVEGNKIVQTWNNQQNFQYWHNFVGLRIGPVKNVLQFSLRGGVRHFISNGLTYKHTYTNWYTDSNVMATYKNAMAGVGIETNRDYFMGETMFGGENIHYVMVGYTYKQANLIFNVFNPFVDNYRVESANHSQYASYRRMMYINDTSRFVALRFSWNFSFGRTFNAAQKRLNNTDEDAGVMSSGK